MKPAKLENDLKIAKLYRRMASSRGETIEFARIDKIVQQLEKQIKESA